MATHRTSARISAARSDHHSRRAHERARSMGRSRLARTVSSPRVWPHVDHHHAPVHDRHARRRDSRDGPRADRRVGQSSTLAGPERTLRRVMGAAEHVDGRTLEMNYTYENELLLSGARREVTPFVQQVDWDYVLATARAHGLLPLLQKHIANSGLVPGHVLSRLKQESVANSQTVLHLVARQLSVFKLFKEHGVSVAIFKGALLGQMAYGEMSLRQAGDIDMLIRSHDFAHARLLLESLGYEMSPRLTPAQLASHLSNHCEIQFMRDEWFTVVDLHWDLAPGSFVFGLKADEVMSRLQSVSLGGTTVETFDAEDLLLYQAMHGAKHLWRRLEWISSLAESFRG